MRRLRRWVTLSISLAVLVVVVPDSGRQQFRASLVAVEGASGLDTGDGVVWILALGSDARPGEPVLRSRADAIQLVGVNARTSDSTVIGIPRDSYVDIPGHGRDKINASLVYGGPELAARAVAGLVGIEPDYVFTTSFAGFQRMVFVLGGVNVYSPDSYVEPLASIRRGFNDLNGVESLVFVRERYALPDGDFDRSRNQGRFLTDGLRALRQRADEPGALERLVYSFTQHTDIDVGPVELYRLARAVLAVDPRRTSRCVLDGSIGMAGSESVVFPDRQQARSLGRRAGRDAKLEGGCG